MQPSPAENPYAPPRTDVGTGGLPEGTVDGLTGDEIIAFVDDNIAYYKDAWDAANRTGGFYAGFNIGAFLFTTLWLLYRKMYVAFAVVLVLEIVVSVVIGIVAVGMGADAKTAVWPGVILCKVAVGFLGNGLYLRRARKVVQQARQASAPGPVNLPYLKTQGGTSNVAVAIGVALNLLLGIAGR